MVSNISGETKNEMEEAKIIISTVREDEEGVCEVDKQKKKFSAETHVIPMILMSGGFRFLSDVQPEQFRSKISNGEGGAGRDQLCGDSHGDDQSRDYGSGGQPGVRDDQGPLCRFQFPGQSKGR